MADLKLKPVSSLKSVKATVPFLAQVRNGKLPGDLESAVHHRSTSSQMFQEEPGTEILSAIGKYEPFRAELLKRWSQRSRQAIQQSIHHGGCSSRGAQLLRVLQACLPKMDGDQQKVWSQNCGRAVSRVLGWLAMVGEAQLGIVRSLGDEHTEPAEAGVRVFLLGTTGRRYVLDVEGEPLAVERLARFCKAADTMQAVMSKPCRTCEDWQRQWTSVRQSVPGIGAPGLGEGSEYVLPWTFRVLALARMRAAGISRLSGSAHFPAASLLDMFPDQNTWLQKLYADLRTSSARQIKQSQRSKRSQQSTPAARREFTAKALADHAGYEGPIELLAMDLCFAGDSGLRSFPPHYLRDHLKLATQLSQQYCAREGQTPHPAVFFQLVKDHLYKQASKPLG